MKKSNLYENEKLRGMPEMIMRPGGFGLTRRLLELAALPIGSTVLDIGCGYGSVVEFLSKTGYKAAGADISEKIILHGKEHFPDAELIAAHAENLPHGDNTFDAVLFECSLSLMDAERALKSARRVLKDNGVLMISDVFSTETSALDSGMTLRSLTDITGLLTDCGFHCFQIEDASKAFKSFIAQVLMGTGSLETVFGCCDMREIKRLKPRYTLITAHCGKGA